MCKAEPVKSLNSQILDCSNNLNHTNNAELDVLNAKLKEEAHQICTILPTFKYESVYAKLYENRYAENRVELSLWDLLPQKRPMVKFPFKRKLTDDTSQCEEIFQNDLPRQRKNVKQNKKEINCTKQSNEKRNSCDEDVIILDDNLANDSLIVQDTSNVINTEGKETISQTQYKNNRLEQMLHNYLQYLDFMKSIKKQKLSGTVEHLDFYARTEIRNMFLNPPCKNFNKKSLPYANTKKILKMSNVEVNCNSKIINNLNDEKTGAISYADSLFNKLDTKTTINSQIPSQNTPSYTPQCSSVTLPGTTPEDLPIPATKSQNVYQNASTNFNKPSISTATYQAHDTNQVVAGTRKKEINWNRKKGILALKCQQIYEELTLIFPDVDKTYIRQMCEQYLDRDNVPSTEQLDELVELILQDKELHLVKTDTKRTCKKKDFEQDEKYAYLSGIFPNADPVYLNKFLARTRNNPDAIIEFVQTQCKHPTYPTKEEKLQRTKITQQQMQYTTKFNVKQFLEIFPDPFTQFENPNRKSTYNSDAFEFLKFYFSQIEVAILKNVYESKMYHLTATAEELENMRPQENSDKNMGLWGKTQSMNIPLLQECAFITHKKQIKEYLDKLKDEEAKEFEKLKKGNELLECQCCYNDECVPSKCSTCADGHIFCNSCILKGTESMLAQGETRILCFTNCDEEFSLPTLQKILSPTQFSSLISKKQEAEVMAAGLEGLVSCPFCHFASIPPPEDKVFKCLNPECMKESCRFCRKLNHIPLKCYEEESDKARLFVEEKMTEALVRKCYKCSRPYFKEDGCNKITCSCGALMCYLCDEGIRSYEHFNNKKCPLWSTTPLVNAATVREVAKKAIDHIKKTNPNATVNEDGLIAYLPGTSNTSNLAISVGL
ncbi:E3 ubiquitin-protein ligase RNF216 [Habropoda laboriosa]|uniref:E3 ubiquitin-protein ligase RNF216 n=1 Tax=Habropoda laboriosa TaxID=597456 RepID=A0A0L7QX26_9HYME|nr:E3 ubiquitin-protein ligase RNF216 [Habropoda laboriosa]